MRSGDASDEAGIDEKLCFEDLGHCNEGPKPPKKAKTESSPSKPKADKAKSKKDKTSKEKASKTKSKSSKNDAPKKEAAPPITSSANPKGNAATQIGAAKGGTTGSDDNIDVQTFLRSLAVRHGLTSDEYLTARSSREWEKLIVATAGRIFNRLVDQEPDDSCRANALGR